MRYTMRELELIKLLHGLEYPSKVIATMLGRDVYSIRRGVALPLERERKRIVENLDTRYQGLPRVFENLGYRLGGASFCDGVLSICINEPPNELYHRRVKADFGKALKRYGLLLDYRYSEGTLSISASDKQKVWRKRLVERFLSACREAVELY